MADASSECSVSVPGCELTSVRSRIRMRSAIGISFESDCWYADYRAYSKSLFQFVIFRLAFCETQSPSIVMAHNRDMI